MPVLHYLGKLSLHKANWHYLAGASKTRNFLLNTNLRLDRQYWISTFLFELNIEFQHWHFGTFLFSVEKICQHCFDMIVSIEAILTNLFNIEQKCQCWNSMLSSNSNVEIQCWAQTAMWKFNIACLIEGAYQALCGSTTTLKGNVAPKLK